MVAPRIPLPKPPETLQTVILWLTAKPDVVAMLLAIIEESGCRIQVVPPTREN